MTNKKAGKTQKRKADQRNFFPRGFGVKSKIKRNSTRKSYGNPEHPATPFILELSGKTDEAIPYLAPSLGEIKKRALLQGVKRKALSPHHDEYEFFIIKDRF